MNRWELWLKGIFAAAIAGGANGIITGFAAVGIDPAHFNLQAGFRNTMSIAAVSAAMSGIIGVAAYLKQSPLPADSLRVEEELSRDTERSRARFAGERGQSTPDGRGNS
jgi:hypothetical protein